MTREARGADFPASGPAYFRFAFRRRSGACVKADAAMDFIVLDEAGSASTLLALRATDFEVRSFLVMVIS